MFSQLEGREMLKGKVRAPELWHLKQSRETLDAGQCCSTQPSARLVCLAQEGKEAGKEKS